MTLHRPMYNSDFQTSGSVFGAAEDQKLCCNMKAKAICGERAVNRLTQLKQRQECSVSPKCMWVMKAAVNLCHATTLAWEGKNPLPQTTDTSNVGELKKFYRWNLFWVSS